MSLAPYERLLELAERETVLLGAGALEDLPALAEERSAIVASLPAAAPREAAGLLSRLGALQALTTASMVAERAHTAGELRSLRRGRGAVHGYAASASQSAARSGRLDGSA